MQELAKRTWHELQQEYAVISRHLGDWWYGISKAEQLFAVGIVCAALMLLGLRSPRKLRTIGYGGNTTIQKTKDFLFIIVVLVIFTFGIDIAIESVKG